MELVLGRVAAEVARGLNLGVAAVDPLIGPETTDGRGLEETSRSVLVLTGG